MAAQAATFESIKAQIRSGKPAPVYILHGEEGYYLDRLVEAFGSLVPEADKEFNQYTLYAPQVEPGQVMDLCRRCPMMAERQLVILKEAQAARADKVNRLHQYVQTPNPSTVLVIVFRGQTAKGRELLAAARRTGIVYESKRIRETQAPALIETALKENGLSADQKSLQMLCDYIGTDLSRLYNEVEKLSIILGKGAAVTPEVIERNIGISKEYNNFELVDAIAAKDMNRAFRIADYFASNPKANPLVTTTALLYGFFSDMLVAFYTKDRSEHGLMQALNMKYPVQVKKYITGLRHYNAFQVIEAIWALRRFDAQSKGRGSRRNEHELFHEFLYHIFTAPGDLGI